MKKIFTSLFLAICFIFTAVFSGCGGKAELQSISITKAPKTEYEIGAQLDLTGGELTAYYTDDSTVIVALTDPEVTVQKPNMNTTGEKTVSIAYQSKTATFKITVAEPKINVTFDMNYAGSQAVVQKVANGEKVTAPADPTRSGYSFLGWYVAADSSSKFNFDSAITAEVTAYAHWGYSVKFDLNYTNAQSETVLYEVGDTITEPATPSRNSYIFDGWFTTNACTTEYTFGNAISANTTVYAGWTQIPAGANVYTVTFDFNDGTGATKVRQVVSGNKIAKPADPTLEGAQFGGWYTNDTFATAYDFNATVEGNMTLVAKWNASAYTATFHYNHANNSGVFKTINNIIPNTRISKPSDVPELDGYYFAGWYADAAITTPANFDNRVNSFLHFYAKWLKEWEFQAEYTDFGEREAFGYSANGTGAAAFINKNNADLIGAHNGYWVANLHNQGLFVEFVITSDAEVFDAAIVLRLSADFYDIVLDKTNFEIKINGTVLDYSAIANITGAVAPDQGGIMNKRHFSNFEFATGVHLVKGTNTIRFTILDSKKYGDVGTMNATAPMFDSMYLNTNANLTWTPKTGNV